MNHAVELYFDRDTQSSILSLNKTLNQVGIKSVWQNQESRPHISMVVCGSINVPMMKDYLSHFSYSLEEFNVNLVSIELFSEPVRVVYIKPEMTEALKQAHHKFHQGLINIDVQAIKPHYFPDKWAPHVTVVEGLSEKQTDDTVNICRVQNNLFCIGRIIEIGLIEFEPNKKGHNLALYSLSKQTYPCR